MDNLDYEGADELSEVLNSLIGHSNEICIETSSYEVNVFVDKANGDSLHFQAWLAPDISVDPYVAVLVLLDPCVSAEEDAVQCNSAKEVAEYILSRLSAHERLSIMSRAA